MNMISFLIHEKRLFLGFCQEAPKVGGVCDPLLGCDCPEGYDCLGDVNDDGIAFTCQKEEDEVTTPAPQSLPAQVSRLFHSLHL